MEEINFLTLQLAKKYTDEHGGGGGGTSNYNDLSHRPQINSTTLEGNMSYADLGIASAVDLSSLSGDVSAIKDGQTIDSFGDVESALANKVDKVDGKGLSTNDYTDADKAIVGGVTAALAGKQGVLTAGKYIDIDANNEISVDPVVPNETFNYVLQQIADYTIKVTKSVNNVVVSEETYGPPTTWDAPVDVTLDEAINIYISLVGTLYYELLIASDSHEAGFKQTMSWFGRDTYTENFSTVDHTGEKLIVKSELDTAINAIKDGQSIDSFADVETALATKADLTDLAPAFSTSTAYTVGQYVSYDGNIYKCTSAHSAGAWAAGDFTLVAVGSELESKQNASGNSALTTTDKTIVGAINEVNSNLTSLGLSIVNGRLCQTYSV